MIELFIYSDRKDIRELFGSISRSKHYRTTYLPRQQLAEAAPCSRANGTLIYLDITGYDQPRLRREMRGLAERGCPWAVVDPEGVVDDPAEIFHSGGCDYLPPLQLQERIKAARIHRVAEFQKDFLPPAGGEEEEAVLSPGGGRIVPSGSDWSAISKGQEYTFFFLFIELLPGEEWKVKSGDKNRQDIQSRFEEFVRRRTVPAKGKIWMWSEWGGVVLFPYSGRDSNLVILATRLMLNRPLISIEEIKVESLVDYRIALHVGNTVYNSRGDTGTIISDDLNYLFHLGKRRVEKNSLYVTDTALAQVPPGMRSLFIEEQSFEGRPVYRMRRFVF